MLTVGDLEAFEQLPEETRAIAAKIIIARIEEETDREDFDRGYEQGFRSGNTDRDNRLGDAERDRVRITGWVHALEDQLRHHGIVPNRQFGAPPRRSSGGDFPRPMGATPAT